MAFLQTALPVEKGWPCGYQGICSPFLRTGNSAAHFQFLCWLQLLKALKENFSRSVSSRLFFLLRCSFYLSICWNLLHNGRPDLVQQVNFCLVEFKSDHCIRCIFYLLIIFFKAFFLPGTV